MTAPVLAIDTATATGGIAVWSTDGLLAQALLTTPREHSKRLFPEIEACLQRAGVDRSDLAAVAVTIGPGSFTGLRIGLSAAKGLCMARSIPLLPVSTLECVAARLPFVSHPVAVLLDARRGEVYAGLYDTSTGHPATLDDSQVATADDVLAGWQHHDALYTGDGLRVCESRLRQAEARMAPSSHWAPDAATLAWLAYGMFEAGDGVEATDVEPHYVRTPQFLTREQQQAARAG